MKKLFKVLILVLVILCISTPLGGCASTSRCAKTINSDFSGGLDRIVTVYDYQGDVIAVYEGKIDIRDTTTEEVMFDMNGKRYIINHAIVITVEK